MVNLLEIGDIQPNGSFRLKDGLREYRRIRPTSAQKQFLADNGMHFVLSSVISAITKIKDDLILRFQNGSMYKYLHAAQTYDEIMNSNSKGKFFNKKIRGKFSYAKIKSLPYPQQIQTKQSKELEMLSDAQFFQTITQSNSLKFVKNIQKPKIKFNLVKNEQGKELLQTTINGIAFYIMVESLLKNRKQSRSNILKQLGIKI